MSADDSAHLLPPAGGDLNAEIVEGFPTGIVVTGADRTVLLSNLQAQRMLGPSLAPDPLAPPTCCRLFGCGRPGTPLAGRCLTDEVVGHGHRVPEMLLTLPGRGDAAALVGLDHGNRLTAVWVSGAPVPGRDAAVLHVRPAERRGSGAGGQAGPRLHVGVLGRLTLATAQGPLAADWASQRPGQVLKLLLAERHRILHPETIAEALWPGGRRSSAANVRYHVHLLRDHLEPRRERRVPSSFVRFERGGYFLDRRTVEVDADAFERVVAAGLEARDGGDGALAVSRLQAAMRLYHDDFLADEPFAEWAFAERDRLRDRAAETLRALAELHRGAGDRDGEIAAMRRLADVDPYDLEVQRRLIALSLAAGRRSEAQRRFRTFRMRTRREFGEDLPFTLADLDG